MTTTTNPLSANAIRDKILNSKGQFVKASWKSNPAPAAAHKKAGVILEKHTVAIVQAGVNYANLSAVKEGIASGERGEVQELPWGQWKYYPYIIEHKDQEYIRLYPSNGHNHIPKSIFIVNGEEVSKDVFASYLTPVEAKKILFPQPDDKPLCFTIKSENIMSIPEDVFDNS